MRKALLALTLALVAALAAAAAPVAGAQAAAKSPRLKAGVGKADITPQTGYYLGGWTRADRIAQGQHTRLFSRAMVLERQGRKFALVQVDLFMVPGGMVKQIGEILAKRGFSERNILISASHTHSGPGGYANFPTLNTAAPSLQTATDPLSFARFLSPDKANPLLYTFLTRQISTAIRRADDDRAMATAGWGSSRITGLTQNRSIEAHLANHGIIKDRGAGKESDDPGGYEHTIDPNVDVLRVDKVRRAKKGRRLKRIPIGAWSTFADHGTVTKSSFRYYNADHHASAMRVFEERVRSAAKVPAKQEVLNVYGNSNEGDMSAGLTRDGPAASDYVGRVEAGAMYDAWRAAGRNSSRTPAFSSRWTRVCFCGQVVEQGQQVASESQVGIPFLTGSEEERGPLFDITGEELEDRRAADAGPPHGVKASVPGVGAGVPNAVPLVAFRLGRRMIVSLPAEGTKEMGARIKAAVRSQIAGSGIGDVVLSGLANEFILYLTTPAGVRPPALRGRQHPVRAPVGEPAQERDRRAGRAAGAQPGGPGALRLRPHQRRRARQRRLRPRGGIGHRAVTAAPGVRPPAARRAVVAGRAAGAGPAGRQGVRDRPAPDAQGVEERGQRPGAGHALERRRRRPLPREVGDPADRAARHLPAAGHRQALPAGQQPLPRVRLLGAEGHARGRPGREVHGGAGLPGGRARRGPDLPPALRRRRPGALQGRLEDRDREAQEQHLLHASRRPPARRSRWRRWPRATGTTTPTAPAFSSR